MLKGNCLLNKTKKTIPNLLKTRPKMLVYFTTDILFSGPDLLGLYLEKRIEKLVPIPEKSQVYLVTHG